MGSGGKIARDGDVCGGGTLIASQQLIRINGKPVICVDDKVSPHPPYDGLHSSAKMAEGSSNLFVLGKKVCRMGDLASCGHQITDGSPTTFNFSPST
jgi:uncharacterized Zn-binding protein involved in type VI secretion